jgi:hypothetical protein
MRGVFLDGNRPQQRHPRGESWRKRISAPITLGEWSNIVLRSDGGKRRFSQWRCMGEARWPSPKTSGAGISSSPTAAARIISSPDSSMRCAFTTRHFRQTDRRSCPTRTAAWSNCRRRWTRESPIPSICPEKEIQLKGIVAGTGNRHAQMVPRQQPEGSSANFADPDSAEDETLIRHSWRIRAETRSRQ